MLDATLIALASAGGTALVSAVATDAWGTAKRGFSHLLSKGEPTQQAGIESRLERTREAIESAGPDAELVRSDQQVAWTTRLEDFLADNPESTNQFRELLAKVNTDSQSTGSVTQTAQAYDNASQAVQGHGSQTNVFGSR